MSGIELQLLKLMGNTEQYKSGNKLEILIKLLFVWHKPNLGILRETVIPLSFQWLPTFFEKIGIMLYHRSEWYTE